MTRKCVFLFGRFQVPTKGHEEMIRYGFNYAKRIGAEFRLYTSKSQDPVKNPLPYRQKIQFLHQLFPGINIVDDPNVKTAFDICRQLSDAGVEDVTMVVGGDRVEEFKKAIGKYVIPRNTPGFDPRKNYAFKNFTVINSGGRKAGVSGTQMRQYIKAGKFSEFMKVAPTKDRKLAREIFTAAKQHLREEKEGMNRKEFDGHLKSFVKYTCDKLGIDEIPSIRYKEPSEQGEQPSFAAYSPSTKEVIIMTKNRHPMDVFRSVAHELVHHKQNLDGRIGKDVAKEGSTGSDIENEANSEAGKIMRYFGKDNPYYFDMNYVTENKAIILLGVPGSGKDRILKETILPNGFKEIGYEEYNAKGVSGNCVVINNVSIDFENIATLKEGLELRGYDTMMVFVNTTDEVSKQRNEERRNKGGRVINEFKRYTKWKNAQDCLEQLQGLFETFWVNNNNDDVLSESYNTYIHYGNKVIKEFANSADYKFESMLNEVGGAGNWGTPKLTHRYQQDTPGQTIGFRPMKVLSFKQKMKNEQSNEKVATSKPRLSITGDRIGAESGFPKGPTMGAPFDDNASIGTSPVSSFSDPITRWMVKEETIKKFRAKYGALAEQKIRETATKLMKAESLIDPYSGDVSNVTTTSGPINDQRPDINAEYEKTSLFGKHSRKRKQLNNKR